MTSSHPQRISIHALLAESDLPTDGLFFLDRRFLSTLSLRRATGRHRGDDRSPIHFYPRSPCGERQARRASRQQPAGISIHALLAESDTRERASIKPIFSISIHALLAESDAVTTLDGGSLKDFYPRSPCGERLQRNQHQRKRKGISIHALLAESDPGARCPALSTLKFLSTLSLRRATVQRLALSGRPEISIHALLAESDRRPATVTKPPENFYPRSPCGERLLTRPACRPLALFLSTLSLRRATRRQADRVQHHRDFYPRSPCGERLVIASPTPWAKFISIHALLAESDLWFVGALLETHKISIHALLAESDLPNSLAWVLARLFLSTLSLRRATDAEANAAADAQISIHALLAESDRSNSRCPSKCSRFLSTLSLRRATHAGVQRGPLGIISIHALLAESDQKTLKDGYLTKISIHALLAESDKNTPSCF